MFITLFCWPLLFSRSGFSLDFTNNMWIGWVQSVAIAAAHRPTLFLSTTGYGLFSPSFLYYGGAPFALVGALSALVHGHYIVVFELSSAAVVAMAYGGSLWLARLAGVRGLAAHAVPLAVVTAAYYATDLYGRSAWPEWVAFSCVPLFVASNWSLYRSERLRAWPLLALVLSTVLFTGSHNVILLWGTMMALALGLCATALLGRQWLSRRRLLRSLSLVALSGALNGWFLLADIFFGSSTGETQGGMGFFFFDSARALFDPLRFVPNESGTPGLYVQLPLWFLAWSLLFGGLVFGVLAKGERARGERRWWGLLLATTGLVVALIMATALWPHLPNLIEDIQYPYRLDGFVYLLSAASLIPVLRVLQRFAEEQRRARFRANAYHCLLAVAAMSIALCGWQVFFGTRVLQYGALTNRAAALVSPTIPPATWYERSDVYDDIRSPIVYVPSRQLYISASAVSPGGNSLIALVTPPDGPAPIVTNIVGGPNVITIGGNLQRIGRTAAGYVVVQRTGVMAGPIYVTVSIASNWQLDLGQDLSLAGAAILLLIFCYVLFAPPWRRRGEPRRSTEHSVAAPDGPLEKEHSEEGVSLGVGP